MLVRILSKLYLYNFFYKISSFELVLAEYQGMLVVHEAGSFEALKLAYLHRLPLPPTPSALPPQNAEASAFDDSKLLLAKCFCFDSSRNLQPNCNSESEESTLPIAALWCLVKYGHALRRLSQSKGLALEDISGPSLKAIRNSRFVVGENQRTLRQHFSGFFVREFSLLVLIEQVIVQY